MRVAVYITTKDVKEARKLASLLLEERLVACANIVPEIESSYWWKGKIEEKKESLLVVKTRKELAKKIIEFVKKNHSYSVPCVNVIPIIEGNPEYLRWVDEETKKRGVKKWII